MLVARVPPAQLANLQAALKSKPHKAALRKAGTTAVRDMKSKTSKRVREVKELKVRAVRRAIKVTRPRGAKTLADMRWGLHFRDIKVPLIDYKPRPTKKGITVAVNKGKRTLIRSAFKARMRTGHIGIFQRKGPPRLPIRELYGSRVVDVMLKEGEAKKILRHGRKTFVKTFDRLLPLERQKAKR